MDPKIIGLIVVILLVVGYMLMSVFSSEDPELSQGEAAPEEGGEDASVEAMTEEAQVSAEDVVPEGAETVEEPVDENEPSIDDPKKIQGLVGWFTGDSWDEENEIWKDLSDAGNDATDVKGSIITDVSNFSNNNKYLIGGVDAGIRFPQECMSTGRKYTMITVARYNGSTRHRIFDGVGGNFFSGFYSGWTGGARRDGSYWIAWAGHQSDHDKESQKFIVHTDMKTLLRRNGIRRSGSTNHRGQIPRQMSINHGQSGEKSDWAVAEVMFFRGELPASEYKKIETYLFKKYMISREIRPKVHTANAWAREPDGVANTGHICGDEGMLNATFLARHRDRGGVGDANGNFDFRGDCIQAMDGGIEDKQGQVVSTEEGEWWDQYTKLINMDCKDKAISGYEFNSVGDKGIRTKFSCHNAALNKQSCYTKETSLGQKGSGNLFDTIDRASIACDSPAQAVTKIEMVDEDGQLKYKYRCCNLEDL